jgi:hypothetical protein
MINRQALGKSKKRMRREEQKSKKENKNQLIPRPSLNTKQCEPSNNYKDLK